MGRWSDEERRALWARWKAGETIIEIGAALHRAHQEVYKQLRGAGGFAPVWRKVRASSLTLMEREEISRGIGATNALAHVTQHFQLAYAFSDKR
jgi:hypothetical protein